MPGSQGRSAMTDKPLTKGQARADKANSASTKQQRKPAVASKGDFGNPKSKQGSGSKAAQSEPVVTGAQRASQPAPAGKPKAAKQPSRTPADPETARRRQIIADYQAFMADPKHTKSNKVSRKRIHEQLTERWAAADAAMEAARRVNAQMAKKPLKVDPRELQGQNQKAKPQGGKPKQPVKAATLSVEGIHPAWVKELGIDSSTKQQWENRVKNLKHLSFTTHVDGKPVSSKAIRKLAQEMTSTLKSFPSMFSPEAYFMEQNRAMDNHVNGDATLPTNVVADNKGGWTLGSKPLVFDQRSKATWDLPQKGKLPQPIAGAAPQPQPAKQAKVVGKAAPPAKVTAPPKAVKPAVSKASQPSKPVAKGQKAKPVTAPVKVPSQPSGLGKGDGKGKPKSTPAVKPAVAAASASAQVSGKKTPSHELRGSLLDKTVTSYSLGQTGLDALSAAFNRKFVNPEVNASHSHPFMHELRFACYDYGTKPKVLSYMTQLVTHKVVERSTQVALVQIGGNPCYVKFNRVFVLRPLLDHRDVSRLASINTAISFEAKKRKCDIIEHQGVQRFMRSDHLDPASQSEPLNFCQCTLETHVEGPCAQFQAWLSFHKMKTWVYYSIDCLYNESLVEALGQDAAKRKLRSYHVCQTFDHLPSDEPVPYPCKRMADNNEGEGWVTKSEDKIHYQVDSSSFYDHAIVIRPGHFITNSGSSYHTEQLFRFEDGVTYQWVMFHPPAAVKPPHPEVVEARRLFEEKANTIAVKELEPPPPDADESDNRPPRNVSYIPALPFGVFRPGAAMVWYPGWCGMALVDAVEETEQENFPSTNWNIVQTVSNAIKHCVFKVVNFFTSTRKALLISGVRLIRLDMSIAYAVASKVMYRPRTKDLLQSITALVQTHLAAVYKADRVLTEKDKYLLQVATVTFIYCDVHAQAASLNVIKGKSSNLDSYNVGLADVNGGPLVQVTPEIISTTDAIGTDLVTTLRTARLPKVCVLKTSSFTGKNTIGELRANFAALPPGCKISSDAATLLSNAENHDCGTTSGSTIVVSASPDCHSANLFKPSISYAQCPYNNLVATGLRTFAPVNTPTPAGLLLLLQCAISTIGDLQRCLDVTVQGMEVNHDMRETIEKWNLNDVDFEEWLDSRPYSARVKADLLSLKHCAGASYTDLRTDSRVKQMVKVETVESDNIQKLKPRAIQMPNNGRKACLGPYCVWLLHLLEVKYPCVAVARGKHEVLAQLATGSWEFVDGGDQSAFDSRQSQFAVLCTRLVQASLCLSLGEGMNNSADAIWALEAFLKPATNVIQFWVEEQIIRATVCGQQVTGDPDTTFANTMRNMWYQSCSTALLFTDRPKMDILGAFDAMCLKKFKDPHAEFVKILAAGVEKRSALACSSPTAFAMSVIQSFSEGLRDAIGTSDPAEMLLCIDAMGASNSVMVQAMDVIASQSERDRTACLFIAGDDSVVGLNSLAANNIDPQTVQTKLTGFNRWFGQKYEPSVLPNGLAKPVGSVNGVEFCSLMIVSDDHREWYVAKVLPKATTKLTMSLHDYQGDMAVLELGLKCMANLAQYPEGLVADCCDRILRLPRVVDVLQTARESRKLFRRLLAIGSDRANAVSVPQAFRDVLGTIAPEVRASVGHAMVRALYDSTRLSSYTSSSSLKLTEATLYGGNPLHLVELCRDLPGITITQ